jgi:hypothetical protein
LPGLQVSAEQPEANCRNCGTALAGRYCHSCGQKAVSLFVSLGAFVADAVQQYVDIDGKIVRTMKLLVTAPGMLTIELLEGRRVRYLTPVRLYLFWSVLFFGLSGLTASSSKPRPVVKVQVSPPAELALTPSYESEHPILARVVKSGQRLQQNPGIVREKLGAWWPTVMFVLVPFFALMVWMVHARRSRFYLPHLYFAIHAHAFVFFLLLVVSLTRTTVPLITGGFRLPGGWVTIGTMLAILGYLTASLRRVYGGGWPGATLRALLLLLLHMVAMLVALAVIAVIVLVLGMS